MAYGMVVSFDYEEMTENGRVEQKKIELVFNSLTLIKYYNYVGRDLYADMAEVVKTIQSKTGDKKSGVMKKAQTGDLTIDDFSDEDLELIQSLNYTQYMEFFVNFFAAMIATKEYNKNLDFLDIMADLPIDLMLTDQEFMSRVSNMLVFGVKKKMAVRRPTPGR